MIAAYVCSHFARFPTAQRDSFPVLKNDVSVTMATGQGEVRRFAWAPEQKNSYLSPHHQNRAIREISMGRKYTQACGPLQKRQDTFRAKSLTKQLYHTLIECSILYWKEEIVFCVQSRHTRTGLPFAATVGSLLREESGHSGGDHGLRLSLRPLWGAWREGGTMVRDVFLAYPGNPRERGECRIRDRFIRNGEKSGTLIFAHSGKMGVILFHCRSLPP